MKKSLKAAEVSLRTITQSIHRMDAVHGKKEGFNNFRQISILI